MHKPTPKTHSKILWHFTGGPKWHAKKKIQLKSRKPDAQAFEVLKAILGSQTLRLGGYHEVMKVLVPQERYYDTDSKQIKLRANQLKEITTSKVCCVADIPITELRFHSQRYGRIAIGFHRAPLLRASFNPVLYTPDESFIVRNFYSAQRSLVGMDDSNIQSEVETLISDAESQTQDFSDNFTLELDGSNIETEAEMLVADAEDARSKMEDSLAFIKTFRKKDFEEIYAEREWRSAQEFKFNLKDVAVVLLPSTGKMNYFEEFIKNELRALGIPKSVKIKKWEDEVL